MTTFGFLLGFLVLLTIALALALWRSNRNDKTVRARPPTLAGPLADDVYRPMARLFAAEDLEFLQDQPGYRRQMNRRLRVARKKALRLYLAQIRQDFRAMHTYCRSIARESRNWELASLAQRQLVVFYGLFLALQVRCLLGSFAYANVDTRDLVFALCRLQQGVRSVAAPVQEGASAAA